MDSLEKSQAFSVDSEVVSVFAYRLVVHYLIGCAAVFALEQLLKEFQQHFVSYRVGEDTVTDTLQRYADTYQMDTHTALALYAAEQMVRDHAQDDETPAMAVLSTAHAAKFCDSIEVNPRLLRSMFVSARRVSSNNRRRPARLLLFPHSSHS